MATKTLTVKEVAAALGTTGRELRKFLRRECVDAGGTVGVDTPGKGKRYAIPAKEVASLSKRFAAWDEARRSDDELEEEELTLSDDGEAVELEDEDTTSELV
jgi:acetylornithine deacetylase/succinyl-diaminopimelate desuccinylase-like protein